MLAAATINPETKEKGLRLFLLVPINENALQFALYRVYNVPTYNANASHGLIYENVPDILAISLDLETFVETNDKDLEHCVKTTGKLGLPYHQGIPEGDNEPFVRISPVVVEYIAPIWEIDNGSTLEREELS